MPILKYPKIYNQPYKILNVGGSKISKANKEIDVDKIHFCIKDPFRQYQYLINKRKTYCLVNFDSPSPCNKHRNTSSNVCQKIQPDNLRKNRKLTIFLMVLLQQKKITRRSKNLI